MTIIIIIFFSINITILIFIVPQAITGDILMDSISGSRNPH